MRRFMVLLTLALPLLVGCTTNKPGASGVSPSATSGGPSSTATASGQPSATASPTGGQSDDGGDYTVRYGFAVPSAKVTVSNAVPVPLPGPIPLPYLVEIRTGDHSTENPAYARISFYFRGAFPSYNIQYVREVLTEGRGDAVALEGNGFLRLQFVQAQAHDATGQSTIVSAANQHIGFPNLKSYGFAGDFEGYLSFGLGVQVAPNSDQVLPVRIGELRKPDGKGGFVYVVAVDIRNG